MAIKSTSKLRYAVQWNLPNLFFSLVDYRNNLLTSNDPKRSWNSTTVLRTVISS